MKVRRKKGYFSISAVAKIFSVHQQTIRMYEKQGFVTPKRSDGGTRLFSEEDIDRLDEIIYLTNNLGINMAGVEMVLKLKKQIAKMQKDMNKLFEQTHQELDKEAEISKKAVQHSAQKLVKINHDGSQLPHPSAVPPSHEVLRRGHTSEESCRSVAQTDAAPCKAGGLWRDEPRRSHVDLPSHEMLRHGHTSEESRRSATETEACKAKTDVDGPQLEVGATPPGHTPSTDDWELEFDE